MTTKKEDKNDNINKTLQEEIKNSDILDKFSYVSQNFLSGGLSGTTGIAQGGLTDMANQAKKGSNKSLVELANNQLRGLTHILNPTGAFLDKAINYDKEFVNTLKDKEKNNWQKMVDIPLNAVQSVKELNPLYEIYSNNMQALGKVNPNIDEQILDINKKISEPSENYKKYLSKESEKYDDVTNFIASGFQSVGNMAPSIAATAITKDPNIGLATMGMSVKGQATQEALDKGKDIDEAVKIGDAKALVEIATEKISGGAKIFGKGSVDDLADELVKKGAKSKIGKFLLKQLTNTGGEIAEEEISNVAGNFIDKGTVDQNKKVIDLKEGLETMGSTAFTTTLLNLLTGGLVNDYNEINTNQYTDLNTGEILDADTQKAIKQAEDIINQNKSNQLTAPTNQISNLQQNQSQPIAPINNVFNQNQTQNQQILPTQQITQQESTIAQNGNMEQIDRQKRLAELKSIDTSEMGFLERGKIKTEIRALEQGYNSIEEYQKAEEIKREQAIQEYEQRQAEKKNLEKQKSEQLKKDIKESTPMKNAQFEIIQKTNPMLDDYHTGIRSPKDIKTFNEVINDEESFAWGDFSKEDAQKALVDGKITIYSSYPIENGVFVSTSRVQAEDYAGGRGNKVYSKEVPLEEVAWINGDEGQYAKAETLANNGKKVYNSINKSITNSEKAQVYYEVRRWRINQEDGIGYIDLSDKGYKSYIYNKQGSNVETLLKVNGSEEFKNFIRKGIEDGTYKKSTNINGWASDAKLQYRNNSNVNDVLPNRGNSEGISGLHDTISRQQTGNNGTEIIKQNNRNEPIKNSNQSSFNMPNNQPIVPINNNMQAPTQPIAPINNTQGETINWNEIERPEGKIRKHYKSIIESSNTTAEAKKIAREMMGLDTYTPRSNQDLLQKADSRINTTNPDTELNSLLSRVMNNEKVNDVDMAVGERLIEYYSKIGDSQHLQDAIHATALAGTQAGRTVQAMALLNHMTPQGQVVWLQRSIEKANKELQQRFKNKQNIPQFELTSEMTDKVLNAKNKETMFEVLNEVYDELGQQVPKTLSEQIDEWRYFSMLANIKTHGRNMIGNLAMGITQRTKNKVAGAIEGTVAKFNPKMERTHTIKATSKEVREFAKNDAKNIDVQTELGMNENKYNPQSRLQSARKTFKSDILNNTIGKLYDLNSNLLEVEDNIGLKSMYVNALGEYITANKIDINNITDAQLSKARQHAIKEAQEATFHQASALATALNQMGRKNNIAKFALDSAVPFKKTPINVTKTGVQYSPVGLIKSAIYDYGKVRNGSMSINQYIDNISKGLTGTGITYMGYVLAQAGLLKASGGDDDKKERYDEEQGKQSYSIEIGGKTYSLDWLSPVGIPLFIGAEINQQFNNSKKEKTSKSTDDDEFLSQAIKKVETIGTAFSNAVNPVSEMSMVSGLTSILSSYNKENAVGDMIVKGGQSYINQFVPTAMGQLARTTDSYERTTKTTKTGTLPRAIDSTINQVKSKIPGLRQTLPKKTDIWGKDIKQSGNLPFRAFNNFINPSTVKEVSTDKVDKELNNLYAKTKESSIIPKAIENKFTFDGTDYRMTNEEYAKYYKNYGKTSYNLIKELIQTKDYNSLTNEQKQKAIEEIYTYAKENNKTDYAKQNKLSLDESTLYKTMKELKNKGGKQSSYLNYIARTNGMEKEKEKNKILVNSNYDDKTKSIIYRNGTGKDDKLYNYIRNSSININEYLKYKIQESEKIFKDDKDDNGKTITSAKEKRYNYINNNITGYDNRLLVLGHTYKLTKKEQQSLANCIQQIANSETERNELLKYYSKNFTEKKGVIYYK